MCGAKKSFEERHWGSCEGQLDSWVVFLGCEGILDSCTESCSGVSEIHFEEFGPGGRKGLSQNCYSLGLCICGAWLLLRASWVAFLVVAEARTVMKWRY